MAKETTKTTVRSACEEYVVKELEQAKKDVQTLKDKIAEQEYLNKKLDAKHKELLTLLLEALSGAKVEEEELSSSLVINRIYINGSYVGLYDKNRIESGEEPLVALAKLIELVHRTPVREK